MPTKPPDQRDLWIAAYADHQGAAPQPSRFAGACLALLPPASRILELGCGEGADAEAFTRAGHIVIATDFVPDVLVANRARCRDLPRLTFAEMRIDGLYPYPDVTFGAVYAHLTLHYYTHDITESIVREIHRVLRPGGWLLFACKSPQDPAWGKGAEIEPDMFDFHGKVRHFFSEDYARSLLADDFTDIRIQTQTGKLYRQRAGWITVIANRT
jgi:SAM-dependent methyltransferase